MSFPTSTSPSTAEDVADALSDQIQGKNARSIAKHANLVVITGYNPGRLKLAEDALKKDVPSTNIRPLVLDLSSLAAVRKAAAEVNAYPEPIHVLIHNACAPIGSFKLTVDALESQMATGHTGPFLLTKLLAPKLLLAAETASASKFTLRVVFVSSIAHTAGSGIDLSAVRHPDSATYQPMRGSIEAKSANIMTFIELARRAKGKINSYSLHPGAIFTAGCENEETRASLQAIGIIDADGAPNKEKVEWITLAQGAAT
ncbi:hypothetical protein C8R44DRAFT_893240 [Mycena epipterygia]|nr:hypothetical protein C8R44DRAFT_893240 [Mycena epipterygia]